MVCSRLAKRFQLSDYAYAHRGLWTDEGPVENSLDACLAAADQGLGIEFDVRPSKDGVPILFHDPDLQRVCGTPDRVETLLANEVIGRPLTGGGEIISLEQLLTAWPATTPLLCEIKIDGNTDPVAFAQTVSEMVETYDGPAACMSFSPQAVAALSSDLMRGQLIPPTRATGDDTPVNTAIVAVDYLACHTSDAANAALQDARARMPLIVWTVRSEQDCAALSSLTDSQIFEGFDPALAKRHILNR